MTSLTGSSTEWRRCEQKSPSPKEGHEDLSWAQPLLHSSLRKKHGVALSAVRPIGIVVLDPRLVSLILVTRSHRSAFLKAWALDHQTLDPWLLMGHP